MDKPNIQSNPTTGSNKSNNNAKVTTSNQQSSSTPKTSGITRPKGVSENIEMGRVNFKLPESIAKAKSLYTTQYWYDTFTYLNNFNTQVGVSYQKIVEQINYRGA